jgi:hypothetical protein
MAGKKTEHKGKNSKPRKKRARTKNIISYMLKHAKYRAKLKNMEFALTPNDIIIPEVCPIFGTPMKAYGFYDAPSLDRIDNTKGYTKDNIVVVSFKANRLKGSASIEELDKIVNFYKNNSK